MHLHCVCCACCMNVVVVERGGAPKRGRNASHTEGTLARGCVVACWQRPPPERCIGHMPATFPNCSRCLNCGFVSHPGVEGSETYDHELCLMCRVALDGKEADIPLETRSRIVCALRYKQYHACTDGQYDFRSRRNGCLAKMGQGRLCKPEDYPYAPTFKCCSELQL